MNWHVWALFAATETVLSLTPGPAVLLVLSEGLGRGALRSLWSSLGILSANAVYFAVSATSLGALLLASYSLFSAIRWAGAAYLVWLGARTFLGHAPVVAERGASRDAVAPGRLFANAFVLQASNPKCLVFFTAILPQFLDTRRPIVTQMVILGVTSIVVEFFVLLAYGALASRVSRLARQPRFATITDRVAGALLIGAGVGLASARR
jgi:threonine/homoserine/homoserine lactone efflux protein